MLSSNFFIIHITAIMSFPIKIAAARRFISVFC